VFIHCLFQGQTKKASDTNYKEKVQDEDIPSERATTLNKSANVASRRNRERQKNGVSDPCLLKGCRSKNIYTLPGGRGLKNARGHSRL